MAKTTPSSLHLTHNVMSGPYTGDENLDINNHIAIKNNYVYVDGINTGINVKGDKGDPGESAYEIYVRLRKAQGLDYEEDEEKWLASLNDPKWITEL